MSQEVYKAALQVFADQRNEFAANALKMGALVQENGNSTRESRIERYNELCDVLVVHLRGDFAISQTQATYITKKMGSLLSVL